jgi:hypothetical protein
MSSENQRPVPDVLSRVKRGLAGYVSYLAACEMNQAFSEYVLYEPTLRILTARRFIAQCEYACPGYERKGAGDKRRIDFVVTAPWNPHDCFALEMKWAKDQRVDVGRDVDKLLKYRKANPSHSAFLCIFGRRSFLEALQLRPSGLPERGRPLYADLGRTRFGCRTFEVAKV